MSTLSKLFSYQSKTEFFPETNQEKFLQYFPYALAPANHVPNLPNDTYFIPSGERKKR